jgi:hypothetical protein
VVLTALTAVYDQLTEPQSIIEWVSSGGDETFVDVESFKKNEHSKSMFTL